MQWVRARRLPPPDLQHLLERSVLICNSSKDRDEGFKWSSGADWLQEAKTERKKKIQQKMQTGVKRNAVKEKRKRLGECE